MGSLRIFFIGILGVIFTINGYTQKHAPNKPVVQDTFFLAKKKGLLGKIGKSIAICTPTSDVDLNATKNRNPYAKFNGLLIDTIIIKRVKFGNSVNDTSVTWRNLLSEAANYFHTGTKPKKILDNLFFKEGDTLFANVLAENERYLRDLSFLQDARMVIVRSKKNRKKVVVTIYYKDVFSLGASGDANGKAIFADVNDDNLAGSGNRLSVQNLFDIDRSKHYGFGIDYLKRNLMGSFASLDVGFQNIANGYSDGKRDEKNLFVKVDLPLVSQYLLWTGGAEVSYHSNLNYYNTDSLFNSDLNYIYNRFDVWAGYNITGRNFKSELYHPKVKQFFASRITYNLFNQVPEKYKNVYNPQYANLTSILGAYTIFKQEYYRDNFIYGFGRSEDVPEGYNLSAIGGWTDKNGYSRPYSGIDFEYNYYSKNSTYFNYTLKAGGYIRQHQFEDATGLLNVESFTRLRRLGNSKWFSRHFLTGSITKQFNQFLNEPIRLGSDYGIPQFNNDSSTFSSDRITINCETVFYNTLKVVGFNFAPFAFTNLSFIKPYNETYGDINGYASVGGGVRTRNENLVFGTIELRMFYFPRTTGGMNNFNVAISSNLRFKYNSQYIKRPDFVTAN